MRTLTGVLLIVLLTVACKSQTSKPENIPAGTHAGTVLEVIPTDNYSYLKIEEKGSEYWIAVTKMDVSKGEKVYFSQSMEMKNFTSKTLNRTFDSILFVQDASKSLNQSAVAGNAAKQAVKTEKKKVSKVEKISLPSGFTPVSEIYSSMEKLSGKTVKVKGKVKKYNPQIMGKNWIHIQDGTDFNGKNDLLITSSEEVKIGSVVSFEGTIVVNKDFGAGYKYEVLLENGKIIK